MARFFTRLVEMKRDVRDLKGIEILAIGGATAAALETRGLRVEAVPDDYRAEGLMDLMSGRRLRGTRVLVPRAEAARKLLITGLRRRGAAVDVVAVYRTVPSRAGSAEVRDALRRGRLDLIAFTSSSTVTFFARLFRRGAEAQSAGRGHRPDHGGHGAAGAVPRGGRAARVHRPRPDPRGRPVSQKFPFWNSSSVVIPWPMRARQAARNGLMPALRASRSISPGDPPAATSAAISGVASSTSTRATRPA